MAWVDHCPHKTLQGTRLTSVWGKEDSSREYLRDVGDAWCEMAMFFDVCLDCQREKHHETSCIPIARWVHYFSVWRDRESCCKQTTCTLPWNSFQCLMKQEDSGLFSQILGSMRQALKNFTLRTLKKAGPRKHVRPYSPQLTACSGHEFRSVKAFLRV